MTDRLWTLLLVLASVGSGLIGGVFFIFSNTCMRAFDALPAAGAVAAMNSINRVILNPGFFASFFGTALLCLVLLIGEMTRPVTHGGVMTTSGALLYLVGSIGVTMVRNVPLNNQLEAVSPSATDVEARWRAYRKPWTRWNHVRTVACLLAAVMFSLALSS